MARFSAQLLMASASRDGQAAAQQLGERSKTSPQAAQLAVGYCGPTGLAAQASDQRQA